MSKPAKKLMADPTDWSDPKENAPPTNVMLIVLTMPRTELGLPADIQIPFIGYWSDEFEIFLDAQNAVCLNELHEIIGYHVITDLKGKTVPVFVPDMEEDNA